MKIQHEDKSYWVVFDYKRMWEGVTQCLLYDDTEEGKPVLVREGFAIKSRFDTHNKEIARKVSLTNALRDLDKETRKVFWEQYLNRKKT